MLDIFGFNPSEALGYGISGLAFLLMFFAFMLLRQVISKGNAHKMIFSSIWGFMGLSFIMTITIGIFSYFTASYKNKELTAAHDRIEIQEITSVKDSISNKFVTTEVTPTTAPAAIGQLKKEKAVQEKALNDLSAKVEKSELPAADKKEFTDLKGKLNGVTDSLLITALPKPKRDSLRVKYMFLNNKINRIPQKILRNPQLLKAG